MKTLYKNSLRFALILLVPFLDSCHHPTDPNVAPGSTNNTNTTYKSFLIRNPLTDLGFAVVDTSEKESVFAFGKKNTAGILTTLNHIVYYLSGNKNIYDLHLSSDFLLNRIDIITNNGRVSIKFEDYDFNNKNFNLSVVNVTTNNTYLNKKRIVLDDDLISKIKLAQNTAQLIDKGGRIAAADCNSLKNLIRVTLSTAGCVFAYGPTLSAIEAALALAPETAGFSAAFAIILAGSLVAGNLMACLDATKALNATVAGECKENDTPGNIIACLVSIIPGAMQAEAEIADCLALLIDSLLQDPSKPTTTSPSSSGGAFGDPHIRTMDGLYYDFQGYGEFVAVKSLTDNFEIQVRQEQIAPYLNHQVTMHTAIAVNTGNDKVCVYPDKVYINNTQYGFGNVVVPLTKGNVSYSNGLITIVSDNEDVVKINIQSLSPSFLDYTVTLNSNRKGKVKGLLGNFDGTSSNDTQTQTGNSVNPYTFSSIYPSYADSWRIDQGNSLFFYINGTTTSTYTKRDFPKSQIELDAAARLQAETTCRQKGATEEPFLSACIMDVALAGSDRYAVSAIGAQESKSVINNFTITKFTSFDGLDLTPFGNAEVVDGLMYLTRNKDFQVAAVYKKYKVDITSGFETSFDFSMTDVGGIKDARNRVGADGIVFVIQDFRVVA